MVDVALAMGTFTNTSNVNQNLRTFISTPSGMVVIALASTYWAYIISAILSLDPWYLLTSFVQYNVMTLSYINILNVYAFCNWHDVSWDTKESDKADSSQFTQTIKNEDTNDIEGFLLLGDIDTEFEKVVWRALRPLQKISEVKEISPNDSYREFPTNFIAVWILS